MQFKFICLIIVFSFLGCRANNKSNNENKSETNVEAVEAVEDINDLRQYIGKLPSEVNIFEKHNIGKRIEKVLGKNHGMFRQFWNVERPIKEDTDILYFSACKKSGCDESVYYILIDLLRNNLNVIHLTFPRPFSFEEGAIIMIPPKIAAEIDAVLEKK